MKGFPAQNTQNRCEVHIIYTCVDIHKRKITKIIDKSMSGIYIYAGILVQKHNDVSMLLIINV